MGKKMRRWIDLALSIQKTGIAGECLKCGSNDTDYKYVTVEAPRGYISIWCNTCNAKATIDCLVPKEPEKRKVQRKREPRSVSGYIVQR